jgi:hypothetical protein
LWARFSGQCQLTQLASIITRFTIHANLYGAVITYLLSAFVAVSFFIIILQYNSLAVIDHSLLVHICDRICCVNTFFRYRDIVTILGRNP